MAGTTFRFKMQKLRTVYTMLENLQKLGVVQDLTLHNILLDIKHIVDDLVRKTKV